VAYERPDTQATGRRALDLLQRQPRDVDHLRRPFDIHLHQIDQISTAGDEFRVWVASDLAHRVPNVVGTRIMEVNHDRPITCSIAATMLVSAPQRQILPLMSSRISSAVFALPSAISPAAEQICPGVQEPHWNASWSMNACCSGCSAPLPARPSIVVICAPSYMTANVRHELTRRPSMSTVQAPHWP